jgi:dihydrodipicolinate synthase/N-acetylneuraminate lyase
MIGPGRRRICILANYSEQFLLTDDRARHAARPSAAHVDGRVPVIVTCSHFSTRIAARVRAAAARAGSC